MNGYFLRFQALVDSTSSWFLGFAEVRSVKIHFCAQLTHCSFLIAAVSALNVHRCGVVGQCGAGLWTGAVLGHGLARCGVSAVRGRGLARCGVTGWCGAGSQIGAVRGRGSVRCGVMDRRGARVPQLPVASWQTQREFGCTATSSCARVSDRLSPFSNWSL